MGRVSANPSAGAQSASDLEARTEAERAGRPYLAYRDGDGRERVFSLDPAAGHVTVGRRRSSDLALDWDGHVSRLHARFERDGDGWAIEDPGLSTNGTWVNSERVGERRRLSDGDTIRIGDTTMTFHAPSGERRAAAPPAPAAGTAPAVDLSTTQLRVLVALCRPYKDGTRFAQPATSQEIAEELFLSVKAVNTHLGILFAKFGIDELPPDQRRVRLAERAFSAGLIPERDG